MEKNRSKEFGFSILLDRTQVAFHVVLWLKENIFDECYYNFFVFSSSNLTSIRYTVWVTKVFFFQLSRHGLINSFDKNILISGIWVWWTHLMGTLTRSVMGKAGRAGQVSLSPVPSHFWYSKRSGLPLAFQFFSMGNYFLNSATPFTSCVWRFGTIYSIHYQLWIPHFYKDTHMRLQSWLDFLFHPYPRNSSVYAFRLS